MKLELTEAVRKTMATAAALSPAQGWSSRVDDWLPVVDEMFAAANSMPEGPPVGTIARRPDGWWIAHRTGAGWEYTELVTGTWRGSDADSWPQIRPDQWPDPTAQQEPTEEDMHPDAVYGRGYAATNGFRDNLPKPPRTPRVVDCLGVEEQGSRWLDSTGWEYFWSEDHWVGNGLTYSIGFTPNLYGPYTEILEPQPKAEGETSPKSSLRVLPSLDCEEARDGTVWEYETPRGNVYRGRYVDGRWKCATTHCDRSCYGYLNMADVEEFGPYREVLS